MAMTAPSPANTLAADLGRFAIETDIESLPALAIERAQMSLASTLASASCGHAIESTQIVRALEASAPSSGSAEVWFSGERMAPERAARVNAMASDSAASDDSDLRSIAHIGTIATSVGLALAPACQASGRDLLGAMVIGYEVAGRIDEALTPGRNQRGFHGSASTLFAAAVTASRLLGADQTQATHAIALCASSACGLTIAADTSWAREYHAGLAAMLGMQAAFAARQGFRSEPFVLEARRGFFEAFNGQAVEEVHRDLGKSWDIVTDMAIKLMPGGHPNHAIAQAAIEIARINDLQIDEIDSVILSAPQLRQWPASALRPVDLIAAAHSLPYFIACALADRRVGWDLFSVDKMHDPRVLSVIDRIRLDPTPAPWPDRFPHRHGGIVIVRCRDGRILQHHCRAPLGSGPTGVEWSDVDAKYRVLMPSVGLATGQIEESLSLIHQLADAPRVQPLIESIRRR